MADGARCPQAISSHSDRSGASRLGGAPVRELAQRLSGSVEVLLLWHPDVDSVELSLQDRVSGTGIHVELAPEDAIDAFYHPYAYASGCDVHSEGTIDNG